MTESSKSEIELAADIYRIAREKWGEAYISGLYERKHPVFGRNHVVEPGINRYLVTTASLRFLVNHYAEAVDSDEVDNDEIEIVVRSQPDKAVEKISNVVEVAKYVISPPIKVSRLVEENEGPILAYRECHESEFHVFGYKELIPESPSEERKTYGQKLLLSPDFGKLVENGEKVPGFDEVFADAKQIRLLSESALALVLLSLRVGMIDKITEFDRPIEDKLG